MSECLFGRPYVRQVLCGFGFGWLLRRGEVAGEVTLDAAADFPVGLAFGAGAVDPVDQRAARDEFKAAPARAG